MAAQGSSAWVPDSDDQGPLAWHALAACRGTDPNTFFPTGSPGSDSYDEVAKAAKRICAWCPVKDECRDWAIRELGVGTANDDLGIYGGLTYSERRSYARKRRATARGTHA
jgi:WhiB family redox-sensing transcriptional regulator